MTTPALLVALAVAVVLAVIAIHLFAVNRRMKRAEYVRGYSWPPGLLDKLRQRHASFTRKETALVSQGLRQFFLAYLQSGNKYVAMPSQVADELWHEFILYTRAYQEFCEEGFGAFLHHTPAVALAPGRRQDNSGCDGSGGLPAAKRASTRGGPRVCRFCSRSIRS